MCRDGHKPGSLIVTRQAIKSSRETPTHSPKKVHNKPHHERISTRPLRDRKRLQKLKFIYPHNTTT